VGGGDGWDFPPLAIVPLVPWDSHETLWDLAFAGVFDEVLVHHLFDVP
jgi:hypothetical protein